MSDLKQTSDPGEENTKRSSPIASESAADQLTAEQTDKILRKYSKEDDVRRLDKGVGLFVNAVAGFTAFFLIYTSIFGALPQMKQRAIYLLFALVMLFLIYPMFSKRGKGRVAWYDYLFASLSMVTCGYVVVMHEHILVSLGISNTFEQALFIVLTVLVLEGTRRLVSGALAFVTICFLLYGYFGHLFPGIFRIRTGGIARLANHLFMIPEGIFGTPLATAAGYVSVFVIFSALLQASGMGRFIQDVALAMTGHTSGGPAKVAVLASALFGTISGSAAANVVGTGTFTIPLMKDCGYPPEFAAATEACASTGGQLVPPVMGAAAFIMSEYIGVPYSQIMLAALIPAFLYYLSVFMSVDFRARKLRLHRIPKDQLPDGKKAMVERGHLLIPFIAVIYMIIRQYTIAYAALWGIVLVILCAQVRKTTRMSLSTIGFAFIDGAKRSISFGVSCACVGLIIGITTMTSVGIILGNYILDISRGMLFPSLILVMVMSILLGMGMPTVAVYIVCATVAAPVLVRLGLPVLAAHMFCFYFGILACITPPVAVPSYAAAAIAGSQPGRTGWVAFKMAFPTFLVPFVFAYKPGMLFIEFDAIQTTIVCVTCIMGILLIAMANEGYYLRDLSVPLRILAFIGGIACIIPEPYTDMVGVASFLFITIVEAIAVRKQAVSKVPG